MTQILVVDDSAVDRTIVGGLLKQGTCWSVDYAENGRQALEMLQANENGYDLVVTDLQMPEMNGLELVQDVAVRYPSTPVVLVTSEGSEEIAIQALAAGASSYSPKRRVSNDLVRTVRNLLRRTDEQRKLESALTKAVQIRQTFHLNNDTTLVSPLVSHLQSYMSNWDESERLRVGVAIDEAILNAMLHGNLEVCSSLREEDDQQFYAEAERRSQADPYRGRIVEFDVELCPERIWVRISDQGPGFDPNELPDPTDPENLDKVSGRGLLLIRTFMDEVRFNETGNEISMVKVNSKNQRLTNSGSATVNGESAIASEAS